MGALSGPPWNSFGTGPGSLQALCLNRTLAAIWLNPRECGSHSGSTFLEVDVYFCSLGESPAVAYRVGWGRAVVGMVFPSTIVLLSRPSPCSPPPPSLRRGFLQAISEEPGLYLGHMSPSPCSLASTHPGKVEARTDSLRVGVPALKQHSPLIDNGHIHI